MAKESLEVQPANGFYQDVESRSTIPLNGAGLGHAQARAQLTRPEAFSGIVYISRVMSELIAKVARVRNDKAPMLITGETGTGKELLARAVHDASDRRERPFIAFNCASASRELIESWLFGHERGAFTGADRNIRGVIREAEGGTLLLDEVGELSLDAQPSLLRFLQENEVHPVGAPKPIKTDVRVIAATNRDLEADVRAGRFRTNLYYRLKVFRFHIPPLRERREDIQPLIEHFLDRYQRESGKLGLRLSDETWELMFSHDWPGNVRELAAAAHQLVAFADDNELIGRESAREVIGACAPHPEAAMVEDGAFIAFGHPLHEATDNLQRAYIINALNETDGAITQAAEILKVDRSGLQKMIKRLGIEVERRGARKSRK